MQHIIYLHGFLSSPKSVKAQQTLAFFKAHFPAVNIHIPQLPGDIGRAITQIESLVNTLPQKQLRFIGSSMGGFLSTYFVEQYGGKAVLVNPAVEPFNLLKHYMGKHLNPYTGEIFYITYNQIERLVQAHQTALRKPEDYFVLLQTGDETLDYRLAEKKYQHSKMYIEDGGNHSFVDYDKHLPDIFSFLR
ncbi:YqiA/YcfP family alpha/beta fold hydrolase [Agaribacter marinus]|uniref:Esterase n=1 Tax=Agaribacter marinus TaxID=1431249 RepID=A0AA37WJV1_9ALTE|nr:YqiA/YcfP family alpha/beta fold hydrolase [Agaribacter marinus]GLR72617.1 esterase [Agaribacter marinus]